MHSIKFKMGSLNALFLLVIIAIITSTVITLTKKKADGLVINLAGRQRMLSQKMTKEVLILVAAKDQIEDQSLFKTVTLFDQTLQALKDGGETIGGDGEEVTLPAARSLATIDQLNLVTSIWNEFKSRIEFLINNIEHREDALFSEALNYIQNNNITLLQEMNTAVGLFQSDSDRKISFLIRFQIFAAIIALMTFGFILYLVDRMLVKPIKVTVNMIKDIAQGEGDLTKRLTVMSKDEISELASWFNAFVGKLQNIIKEILDSSDQLNQASNEISKTAELLSTGAEEQQIQLSEIATSMEEMSALILESSRSAQFTSENTGEAKNAAITGQDTVRDTVSGIEEIAKIVLEASEQIRTLEIRSQEIGEVIQVIDDIADQTNLLALNANIEAARAGDAGRGFAVVADEVRKLAERTVVATAEISEKIKQIQNDVSDSVKAMVGISERSKMGQELALKSGSALEAIASSVTSVNQAVLKIASAADEQSTGAEEISRNIEMISSVSKDTALGSLNLANSAEEMNREVRGLNNLIKQFRVE